MCNTSISLPCFRGVPLSELPGGFSLLQDSTSLRDCPRDLRACMEETGYVYLPGLLNQDRALRARLSILQALAGEGMLNADAPLEDAVARPGVDLQFRPDLANGTPGVDDLLYAGEMMDFWKDFLGSEVRHFDYTWLRAKAPAEETVANPHCDTVFMNRGTPDLYTAWPPLGPVPYDHGGLMILEGSQRGEAAMGDYWQMDVDTYCTNGPEAAAIESGETVWQSDRQTGVFRDDVRDAQQVVGGRWLIAEYQSGDLLVFGMRTLHAAADNQTTRIRLSTDSRYQQADEPADERWVGPNSVGHGPHAKIGIIC